MVASTALGVCLLLSTASLAMSSPSPVTGTPFGTEDCRLVPNPDECYRAQSEQRFSPYSPSIPTSISTETLGLSGPFQADLRYDADLSWIFGLKYLHMFNESFGVAGKFTAGPRELRGNITAGYALSKDHQFKITYEYLRQDLPFDFASGTVREWVDQHALGFAYQYLIRHEIFHSLELSAYTIRANNKELPDVVFNQQFISPDEYIYDVNYRRIAGGTENTALVTVNLFPFINDRTTFTLGGGYSTINYHTRYESNQAAARLAYKAELTHLLTPKTKVGVSSIGTAATVEYNVGLSHLLPNHFEASLKAQYAVGQGDSLPSNKSITLGVTYPAPDTYSLSSFGDLQTLKNWIDKPVVYATRVLAIKDELVKRYGFKANVGAFSDQSKEVGQQIDPVPTSLGFSFTDPNLNVTYTVFITKTSGAGIAAASEDSRDFTKDLDLVLVPNGANQATLQSAATTGIPVLDSENNSTVGIYRVTLTAVGTAPGVSPVTFTNGFTLTVTSPNGPIWDTSDLPDSHMGFPYPNGITPSSSASIEASVSAFEEINLTKRITLVGDESVDIKMEPQAGCTHPDWIVVDDCVNEPGQCLRSEGVVPNDKDIDSFCVRLVATAQPSRSKGVAVFHPIVHQKRPVWVLPPQAPAREYNVDPSEPINLRGYIQNADSESGLAFQKGQGFDTSKWTFDGTAGAEKFALNAPVDISFIGLKQVPITATNLTSYGPTPQQGSQLIPVAVVDSSQTANWVRDTLVPDAFEGEDYEVDLNRLLQDALVQTTNVPGDIYDFTIVSTSQGTWDPPTQGPDGGDSVLVGKNLTFGTVAIDFQAWSHATGKNAIKIGGGGDIQTVTLQVKANTHLQVKWTGEKTLADVKAGDPYTLDLNKVDPALVKTTTADGQPVTDTYVFKDQTGTTTGWTIDPDTGELKNDMPKVGPVTLVLTAKSSDQTGNKFATGGTGGSDETQQLITFNVVANPNLSVDWTGVNTLPLPSPEAEVPYSIDLNALQGNAPGALVKTTNNASAIVPDNYVFDTASGTDDGWTIDADKKTLINPSPVAGVATIILTATSKTEAAPTQAKGGNGNTTYEQKITVTVKPKLDVTWVTPVPTIPAGEYQKAYSEDLNAMGLVVTTDHGTPVDPADTYTFTKDDRTAAGWDVVNGKLENDAPEMGDFDIYLTAVSAQAAEGKDALGGNVPDEPKVQKITVHVGTNSNLDVQWENNPTPTLKDGTANVEYTTDLNLTTEHARLVKTRNGIGGPELPADTYTFEFDQSDLVNRPIPTGWSIPDGTTLTNNTPTEGSVDVYLIAKSAKADNKLATNGNVSENENVQKYTITIKPNKDLTVKWAKDVLPDGESQTAYSEKLNDFGLVTTTNNGTPVTTDTYTFRFDTSDPDKRPIPAGWDISTDGKTLSNPTPVAGDFDLYLQAISKEAGPEPDGLAKGGNVPADETIQKITVHVAPNDNLKVEWQNTPTEPTLKQATAYEKYTTDLNKTVDHPQLVKTNDGDITETYTFAADEPNHPLPTGWRIENGTTLINDSPRVGTGSVDIYLTAHSPQAGKLAAKGNFSADPAETVQKFTITINANDNLQVEWTGVNQLPSPGFSSKPYEQDLRALQGTADALVKTLEADGITPITDDTYNFEVVKPASDAGWDITDDHTLTHPTGVLRGTANIILKAWSTEGGKYAVNGTGTSDPTEQLIHVTINANPDLSRPMWVSSVLPSVGAGQEYGPNGQGENLNALSSAVALVKTDGIVDPPGKDTFDFTFENTPTNGDWTLEDDPATGRHSILRGTNIQPGPDIEIYLRADSYETGLDAWGGDVAINIRKVTVKVLAVPQFDPNLVGGGQIQFDTTGDGNELGQVTDGILLNTMLQSNTFSDISFNFAAGGTESGNWVIKDLDPIAPATQRRYFLVRKLTLGTPNTVNADDVDLGNTPNVTIPQIKVCTTDGTTPGNPVCSTSDASGSNAIKVLVKPDTRIVYQYADAAPSSLKLVSATSDGNGNPATGVPQDAAFTAPTVNIKRFTSDPATNPNAAQVLLDTDATFPAPSAPRSFIGYGSGDGNLTLDAPTGTQFITLMNTPDTTYLNAKSRANNGAGVDGNLTNLPPITGGKLILVPSMNAINQPYTLSGSNIDNLQANVAVGINALPNSCTSLRYRNTTTAFVFNLPAPPAGSGKSYYLTRLNPVWAGSNSDTQAVGICNSVPSTTAFFPSNVYQGSGGVACGGNGTVGSRTNTFDGTGMVGDDTPTSYCTSAGGLKASLPKVSFDTPGAGTLISSTGGNYTLFVSGDNMNRGLMNSLGPDIPATYMNGTQNMTQLGTNRTAATLGVDYQGYSDFPVVELR